MFYGPDLAKISSLKIFVNFSYQRYVSVNFALISTLLQVDHAFWKLNKYCNVTLLKVKILRQFLWFFILCQIWIFIRSTYWIFLVPLPLSLFECFIDTWMTFDHIKELLLIYFWLKLHIIYLGCFYLNPIRV